MPDGATTDSVPARRAWTESAFAVVSRVLLGAVVVQVFLAGLGLFGASDFDAHRLFAFVLHAVTLSLVALAALGRRGALVLAVTVALAVLVFVQGLLVVVAARAPVVGALHPVGALVLFAGARWLLHAPSPHPSSVQAREPSSQGGPGSTRRSGESRVPGFDQTTS